MTRNTDFSGLTVALATPFQKNHELDLPAFRRVVRHVVDGGADHVVVLGSTGEAATVLDSERDALITACLEEARAGARPARVIVGTGHNATRQAAAWTRRARDLGADGALVVTPYYNKPMPAGIVAHFAAVAEAAPGLPLIAYNVPGRTGLNLAPKSLEKLWQNEAVVALKESSGNLAQIGEIARCLPPGKQLLAGDDNFAMATIALGGVGLVSVIGNVLPRETTELVAASRRGDVAAARAMHHRLLPMMDALFLESNPIPTKAALAILGLCENVVRLPLTPAEESTQQKLSELLRKHH
jgi:4-hydroxy-tetrahydrodipicolinate synthase